LGIEISKGIQAIHRLGAAHCDIKTSNVPSSPLFLLLLCGDKWSKAFRQSHFKIELKKSDLN